MPKGKKQFKIETPRGIIDRRTRSKVGSWPEKQLPD